MIDFISVLVTIFIGFSFNLYIFKKLTKQASSINFKNLLILLFSSILLTVFNMNSQTMLNTLGNLICTCILIYCFYDKDLIKSSYYSLVIWILTLFTDMFVSLLIMNSGFNFYDISNNYLIRCIILVPMVIIELLIISIKPIFKMINNIYEKYYKRVSGNAYFSIFISLFLYIFLILIYLNLYESDSKFIYYTMIVIMAVVMILIIILIKFVIKSYELSIINKFILNENELMKDISNQDQLFKHNLINKLITVESISNKKSKKLIMDLIESYKSEYKNISNINGLPNGIRGVIYKKAFVKNIKDLNLIVENEIEKDLINILKTKKYSIFCESVGLLFDNALEAVENCEEKIIHISITIDDNKIYFIIKNNFENLLDLENIGNLKYTTKTKGHGIGINYLLNNKNVCIKNSILNNLFVVELSMKIKK